MAVVKIETYLPDVGDDLIITRRKANNETVPAYSCIGGNMTCQTREKSYPDLFGVLKELSKSAAWLFWSLVEKRNTRTNISVFKAKNAVEARKITIAYQELHTLNIVLRIKQQHYLINPKVMLPEKNEYMNVKIHWNSLANIKL